MNNRNRGRRWFLAHPGRRPILDRSTTVRASMGVVMERWCPTQQMLGVFLKENTSEEATSNRNYRAVDGNLGISAVEYRGRRRHGRRNVRKLSVRIRVCSFSTEIRP